MPLQTICVKHALSLREISPLGVARQIAHFHLSCAELHCAAPPRSTVPPRRRSLSWLMKSIAAPREVVAQQARQETVDTQRSAHDQEMALEAERVAAQTQVTRAAESP